MCAGKLQMIMDEQILGKRRSEQGRSLGNLELTLEFYWVQVNVF